MTDAPHTTQDEERRLILLVEDALDQAVLVRTILEGTGLYRVTHVQDGIRGSDLARGAEWDLIITDLNLPGAYGMAVIEASRAAHPATPVLATTAYTGPEYVDRAREAGADDVAMKPLDRDDFLARVATLIGGQSLELLAADDAEGADRSGASATATAKAKAPSARTGASVRSDTALQVLAVGIRPGEVELGCGGTLLRHRARGDRVMVLVLSKKGEAEKEQARAATQGLGARFYVGTADPSDHALFAKQTAGLVLGALQELRPDILYLPTPHRRDPLGRVVAETAMEHAADVPRIFRYDAGDPTPEFDPDLFVPVGETLEDKLAALRLLEPPQGSPIHPQEATTGARFWGRFAGGDSAEPLEAVRGTEPWEGADEA